MQVLSAHPESFGHLGDSATVFRLTRTVDHGPFEVADIDRFLCRHPVFCGAKKVLWFQKNESVSSPTDDLGFNALDSGSEDDERWRGDHAVNFHSGTVRNEEWCAVRKTARETTDVLILDWPMDADEAPLFSLGRALILSGARLLELDSRELGLELKPRGAGEFSLLIYDTTPGGAGHCFELINLGRPWLRGAQGILRGSPAHDASCRRACLECLLDFAGQFQAHRLDRKGALNLLTSSLDNHT